VAPESLAFADIRLGNNNLRVFTTHLKSINLNLDVNQTKPVGMFVEDSAFFYASPSKKQKIEYFTQKHVQQAYVAKQQLNKSPYPYVFCADLNSVPSSYVYHTLSKGLTDAFVAKGSGLSPTYSGLSPTLRIDVVLMSPQLTPRSYYAPRLQNASDHYPVITDIQLPVKP
jgi:endonuclease/exonuclease/phosphatase family metal-dependent hydrolase